MKANGTDSHSTGQESTGLLALRFSTGHRAQVSVRATISRGGHGPISSIASKNGGELYRRQRKPCAGRETMEPRGSHITATLSTSNVVSLYLFDHSDPSPRGGFCGRGKYKAWNYRLAAHESSDNVHKQ
jgi:hypothetical protein